MDPHSKRPSPRDERLSPVEMPDNQDLTELNRLEDEDDSDGQVPPRRIPFLLRFVAFLVAASFLAYAGSHWLSWWSLPALDFLRESPQVKEERDLYAAEQAIVEIQAYSSTQDGGVRRGTGFNVLSSGLIVTNAHIVENAWTAVIRFPDGQQFTVDDWTIHEDMDLAIVNLDRDSLPVLPILLTGIPEPGDRLTILGNPLGFPRVAVPATMAAVVQLEAGGWVYLLEGNIYPGSSGSPVLNERRQVVAVVFAVLPSQAENVRGLAVPVVHLQDLW